MYFLLVCYLFFDEIVSLFFTLLNVDFSPENDISIYVYLKVTLGLITILYCVYKVFLEKKISLFMLFMFFFCIILSSLLLITSINYTGSPFSKSTLISILYLLPFLFLCGYLIPIISFEKLAKAIPIIIFILLITGCYGLLYPIMTGNFKNALPGFTYQNTSYFFSMGFLLIVYQLITREKNNNLIMYYIKLFIALIFLGLSLIGGGKGAVFTNFSIIILFFFFDDSFKFKYKLSINFLFLILFIVPFFNISNENITMNLNRAFSIFSTDVSTVLQNSNGRDFLYNIAWKLINEKPIFGWGIGSSYFTELKIYPHNLFLELFLDGGIVFVTLSSLLILMITKNLFVDSKKNKYLTLLSMGFIFNLISLQFSGSYLYGNYFFWLGILYSLYHLLKKNMKPSNSIVI